VRGIDLWYFSRCWCRIVHLGVSIYGFGFEVYNESVIDYRFGRSVGTVFITLCVDTGAKLRLRVYQGILVVIKVQKRP
jgi:hypothetical protein